MVTPNAITIASIFLGVGAGVCFGFNDLWVNIAGMLLLIWANSFDSADGQLARLTHQYSRLGRILDGVSGDLWFAAIYIAIVIRENATIPLFHDHPWQLWVIALTAGFFHAKQASTADCYRQFHLYFLKGSEGSELDSSASLRRQLSEAGVTWRGSFFRRLSMEVYIAYTRSQERFTPQMQALRRAISERWSDRQIPPWFRDDFRRQSLPLMKYTNILTFNWRSIGLFVTLFIGQPWLYFIYELTLLNLLWIYMIWRHERMCRRLLLTLRS